MSNIICTFARFNLFTPPQARLKIHLLQDLAMKSNDAIIDDYRKWLLYSFDNNEFSNYYDLFKALKRS